MGLHEPETAAEAEESRSFWQWIISNKLYRSTEFGGLHYITISDSKLEVIFWYVLFFVFGCTAIIHAYISSLDLQQQTIESKILAKLVTEQDFDDISHWTFCKSGEYGGASVNSPNWDLQYIMALDRAGYITDGNDHAEHYMNYLDQLYLQYTAKDTTARNTVAQAMSYFNSTDDGIELQNHSPKMHLHLLIIRKIVQLQYRYSRSTQTFTEYFSHDHEEESIDYLLGLDGSYTMNRPAEVWLMIFDHYKDYMNPLSVLRQRMYFVTDCNEQLLSSPNPYSNTSIVEYYTAVKNETLNLDYNESVGHKFSVARDVAHCFTDPLNHKTKYIVDENNDVIVNSTRPNIDGYLADYCFDNVDYTVNRSKKILTQLVSQCEQMFLADLIAMNVGRPSQTWFHGGNLSRSLQIVHHFVEQIEYRMRLDSRYRMLSIALYEGYAHTFVKQYYKANTVKANVLYMTDHMECMTVQSEVTPSQMVMRAFGITLETLLVKKSLTHNSSPELTALTAKHQKWVRRDNSMGMWIAPDNPDVSFKKTNLVKFNVFNTLTLTVTQASKLLSRKEQPCSEQAARRFDCLLRCTDQEIRKLGSCLSPFVKTADKQGENRTSACTIEDMQENINLLPFTNTFRARATDDKHNPCNETCQMQVPCEWTKYAVHVAYEAKQSEEELIARNEMHIVVKTEVPGQPYYFMEQSEKTYVLGWVATLGGVLEFWLGAGLLSLIHFVLYFLKMLVRHVRRRFSNQRALRSHASMIKDLAVGLPMPMNSEAH